MITPTQRFYTAAPRPPRKVAKGIDRGADWVSGAFRRRSSTLRRLLREAEASLQWLEQKIAPLSEDAFQEKLDDLHRRFRRGETSSLLTREAFAAVSRVAQESMGLTPYREQIAGAMAIHESLFAEMATGEGKTLTIGLAATLSGWTGNPCHVITANDYLAQRDAETLSEYFAQCGIRAGFVTGSMKPPERISQHQSAVVYTTSQEILADFLRDKLKLGSEQTPQGRLIQHLSSGGKSSGEALVMRGIHTVIIDEADNILIDEAVTPLIISQTMPGNSFAQCCSIARDLGAALETGIDYTIDYKHSEITLTHQGIAAIGRHSHRFPAIWRSYDRRNELVRQSLVAEHFFIKDKHYVITDESKVEIVDEFTGRILPGRTWKQGLHQTIETKENIPVTDPTETLASMSFQRFFRMFHSIAGVSGTASESSAELWRMYRLAVVCIPTHRPVLRKIEKVKVYPNEAAKYEAVVGEIDAMHQTGRPVLVGTRTVEASEALSRQLTELQLPHTVLNAVRHKEEAAIVSEAGKRGSICIATNMAGRGTDIKLSEEVLSLGGLHVIVVEHNLSPRIDRQLIGRSARQGEPGSARYYIAPDDELLIRFLRPRERKQLQQRIASKLPGSTGLALNACRKAQKTAEKMGEKQREAVLKMDTWMEEHLAFTRASAR
ncbi:MAG: DEAD/DEAH box helicase [Verrucomicrobiales bacterium]|nr:DEAD/DEAH box helicase [Verrucomicrobiales bacterium]